MLHNNFSIDKPKLPFKNPTVQQFGNFVTVSFQLKPLKVKQSNTVKCFVVSEVTIVVNVCY